MATEIGKGTISVGFDPQQVEQAGREQLLPSAQRLATDLAAAFAAVKLIDIGKSGLAELEQSQKVSAQTAVQLKATGDTAGVTAAQIDTLGQSMLDLAGFDDEAARSAANVLTRFQAFQGLDELKRVEGDAADLAVTMGSDLPAAAQTLGQILQSPENAARRLRPIIGDLTQAQKDAIEAFTNAGDVESAQQVILEAIEARVKGAAAAYGDTLPGQIDKATQSWSNAKAELVSGFAPAIELGANLTTKFAQVISTLPEPVQASVGGVVLLGGTIAAVAQPVGSLVTIYEKWTARSREAEGATTALAGAETDEAAASTASAATKGHLASTLGKAGVAGAALLAVGAIVAFGDSLNTAADSQERLDATTRQSADDANRYLAELRELSQLGPGHVGAVDFSKDLEQIAEKGPAGVAVLQNYSNFLHQTGQNAEDVDRIIRNFTSGQQQFNTNVSQGNTILGNTTSTALTAGQSLTQLNSAQEVAAQSSKDLAAAQQANNQERSTRLSSVQALFDAERQQVSAEQQLTSAQRGVTDALRGVEDARRRVTDAIRSQNDAVERLADAEEALQKAQQPADSETVGKAELALSDARLRQAEAQAAVTRAEKDVANARKDGKHSAADVADLDLKVQEAKNNVTAANFGLIDAEKALQDVQKKGTDQDQAVVDAKKQVESAERNVADAAQGVADAQRNVTDAQQRVIDARSAVEGAYLGIAAAAAGVKDKQDALFTGTTNATTSLYNQVSAFDEIRDKLDPGSPLRKNIDGYIGDLSVLRDIFTLDSSVPTEDILGRHISSGQPALRDSGGPLRPGQKFEKRTPRAELLVETGTFRAPDYTSIVLPPDATRDAQAAAAAGLDGVGGRGSGDINWYGDVINPVPEPASSSVGHQLSILADRLAGAV